ncbi:hypothetical protein DYB28_013331 [Aphanomyces astaci]|uniref:MULE transposase domain-containing protein n=1 Tax=Aphanomyces astaci TaxID=112090 RepID=A0A397C6T6_APHAT|nr:hypothetical protein DYB36_011180 [Aphanomyces astaci]RHY37088.1 hypothetical protein DYB25_001973 [Aphanomyces astaci]RHY67034.1 hypothetical protein DYB38_008041 [Aphanomyces astaci]RHY69447.1 hypothetical protein DYB34_011815 [Aphanomyces astaci]RHY78070.1 hypothetical protein DYB30_014349 [Aphanomyces astaci]
MGHNSHDTVAVAVVPAENHSNWEWFIGHLIKSELMPTDTVIVSDRQKGLIKACQQMCPHIPHRFCMRHIVANIKASGTYLTPEHEGALYKLARSDSQDTYDLQYNRVLKVNPGAALYVDKIPKVNWVTFAFPRPTFDNVTSNLSEAANSWLGEDLRSSDIVTLHFKYLMHMLKNINARRFVY